MSSDPSAARRSESPPASAESKAAYEAETIPPEPGTSGEAPTDATGILADHPRYRIVGLLGAGGMGAVYRAEHRLMQRPVALKVISPNLMRNPAAVERFRREVHAAARLSHPNIVIAYDAEQAGDVHFLAMELVEGVDLAEVVRRSGPLPVTAACEYIRQAALGLQHASERGMVHRDIKPHNLMLTGAGQIKILDFGLARFASESPSSGGLTEAGAHMGTADYIAPEQAQDPRTADIRADIYSLGCTLYHLLCGHAPFPEGTMISKVMAHVEQTPPSLTKLRGDVPPELSAIVARMMAKKPEKRFQTPTEVAEALMPFTVAAPSAPSKQGQGVAAPPARPREPKATAQMKPPSKRPPLERTQVVSGLDEAKGWRRWQTLAIVTALAAAAFVGAFAVVRVSTDRGDLVIKTEDPDVKVEVQRDGQQVAIIDLRTNRKVDLRAGDYQIALADGEKGLRLSTDTFTIKRGETKIVSVRREPHPQTPQASPPPTMVAEVPKPAPPVVKPPQPAKESPAAPSLDWSAEDIRLGKIHAPDFSSVTPLYHDDFSKPTSRSTARDPGVKREGHYWLGSDKGPGSWRRGGGGGHREFACEVEARSVGQTPLGWGVALVGPERAGKRHGFQLKFFGRELQMFPLETAADVSNSRSTNRRLIRATGSELRSFSHSAIKPLEELNSLLVVVHGGRMEIYVNSVAVCLPIPVPAEDTPTHVLLCSFWGAKGGYAEFARMMIWPVEDAPGPSAPGK